MHVGTLGLVVEPMAGVVEDLARQLPSPVLLMLDPNWRASAIPDPAAHLDRIRRLLARTDIVKTSSEDLGFLVPGGDVPAAARTLLSWGARCVLVTDGPETVQAFTPDGQRLGGRCRGPRWWTRSAPVMRSAAASWPGGLSVGSAGSSWPTVGC